MRNTIAISLGKLTSIISSRLNIGSGSTWPGHIALSLNDNFIRDLIKKNKLKIIVVAGTNGKTTTSKMIQTILENNHLEPFRNESGANLLNGIASILLTQSDSSGKISKKYAILEVDENVLPLIFNVITPNYLLLLNLFRDQLDRYGEVDSIARKWKESLEKTDSKTTLIVNGDDPSLSYVTRNIKGVSYFGLNEASKNTEDASDSSYCLLCGSKLLYSRKYFSHLGVWKCGSCGFKRPEPALSTSPFYPMPGNYNKYNTLASLLLSKKIGIDENKAIDSLKDFKPAFGRQETFTFGNKKIKLFLSKNPISFNESLRTILSLGSKNILIVLNDRIPDGRDVSWIWDTSLIKLGKIRNITLSGDRVYDLALRLKYQDLKGYKYESNLKNATHSALKSTADGETLYILPTYSAMLDVRKILTGRSIL